MTDKCNRCQVTEQGTSEKAKTIGNLLLAAERLIMNISSVLIVLTIVFAVVVRYFFHANLYGYEEIVTIFAFWMYFMGGAYGSAKGTHISADLVNAYLPDGKLKQFMCVLRGTITTGVSALFTWYGFDFFLFGFLGPLGTGVAIPCTPVWRLPMWISYASISLGFILMTLYFSIDLYRDIKILFGKGNPPVKLEQVEV